MNDVVTIAFLPKELVATFRGRFNSARGSRLAFSFNSPGVASNSRKALLIPTSFRILY
jgi:hypothetical protein